MGWRKWTILDGDLARCSELQRPRGDAELRPCQWGDPLMRQHRRVAGHGLTASCQRLAGPGGVQ
jgi:hypothetical protein